MGELDRAVTSTRACRQAGTRHWQTWSSDKLKGQMTHGAVDTKRPRAHAPKVRDAESGIALCKRSSSSLNSSEFHDPPKPRAELHCKLTGRSATCYCVYIAARPMRASQAPNGYYSRPSPHSISHKMLLRLFAKRHRRTQTSGHSQSYSLL